MSSNEKPPIFTDQADYDREVKQLDELRPQIPVLEEQIGVAGDEVERAEAEYNRARNAQNDRWLLLRQVTRSLRRWQTKVKMLKEQSDLKKGYDYWLTQSINTRWTATERYLARQTAQRLKPSIPVRPERLEADTKIANERVTHWTTEQTAIINTINTNRTILTYLRDAVDSLALDLEDLEAQLSSKQSQISKLEDEIPRKRVTPLILISLVDSETGYLLTYFKERFKDRHAWLYDEELKKTIQPLAQIRVEYTLSIETSGHEDIAAELTCWTFITSESDDKSKDLRNIIDITDRLMKKAEDWFIDNFGNIPSSAMHPDFHIQEVDKGAIVEGFIQEWYQTIDGKWEKKPRVIKRGVGFYSTSDAATWPLCYIYCEFGHDEEPIGTHQWPKGKGKVDIIDP